MPSPLAKADALRAKRSKVGRLVVKLRAAGYPIGEHYLFTRLRPGHWLRASGAWSWCIRSTDPPGYYEIGSGESVTSLLKAKGFVRGEYGTVYSE